MIEEMTEKRLNTLSEDLKHIKKKDTNRTSRDVNHNVWDEQYTIWD